MADARQVSGQIVRVLGVSLFLLLGFGCVPSNIQFQPYAFENEEVLRAYWDRSRNLSNGAYITFEKRALPDAAERRLILRFARQYGLGKPRVEELGDEVMWKMEWPYWRFSKESEAFCRQLEEEMGDRWRGLCLSYTRLYIWSPLPPQPRRNAECGKLSDFFYALPIEETASKRWEWARSLINRTGGCPKLRDWLLEAVRHGELSAVTLALELGVAVNARDGAGWSALHHALVGAAGHVDGVDGIERAEIVSALLEADAQVDAMTSVVGWAPLHLAAGLGEHTLVSKLLERGAQVNARARLGGWTPLDVATRSGADADVIAALEANGARYGHRSSEQYLVYFSGLGRWTELPFALPERSVYGYRWRGTFVEPKPRERLVHEKGTLKRPEAQERLVVEQLGQTEQGQHLDVVGVIDGGGFVHPLWITDRSSLFLGLCRDYAAGQDHVQVIRQRTEGWRGNEVEVWRYDESDRRFALGYSFELLHRETPFYECSIASRTDCVGAERVRSGIWDAYEQSSAYPHSDYCVWENRMTAAETYADALEYLQVGQLPTFSADGSVAFPTRAIDSSLAERLLQELRAMPSDVGAVANGLEFSEGAVDQSALSPEEFWAEQRAELRALSADAARSATAAPARWEELQAELGAMPADVVQVMNGLEVSEGVIDDSVRVGSPAQGPVASDRWEIFLITGAGRGADGRLRSDEAVLVHDKLRQAWRSIYDCTDLKVLELRGNTLIANIPNKAEGCGSSRLASPVSVQLDLEFNQLGNTP